MIENNLFNNKTVLPFLKWAGGKRWLANNFNCIFPLQYNRYIEPFLGSGAIFFHLQPEKSILGDKNKDLIDTYIAIKENFQEVFDYLKLHHENHSKSYYYNIRKESCSSLTQKAAKFIYLNRTCFNGLYRVNKEGVFNVPIGTKRNVILETDDFKTISNLLKGATLKHCDFEEIVNLAEAKDLLFIDPPYTVKHNNNGFIKYNEQLFSWEDQERLAKALIKANQRGVIIISTNALHTSLRELYQNHFITAPIERNSMIAGKSSKRGKTEELLIMSSKI